MCTLEDAIATDTALPACRHLSQALTALARLHILNEKQEGNADEPSDVKELHLNQRFRENFRLALTGGCATGGFRSRRELTSGSAQRNTRIVRSAKF